MMKLPTSAWRKRGGRASPLFLALLATVIAGCSNLLGIGDFSGEEEVTPADDHDELSGGSGGVSSDGGAGGGEAAGSEAWAAAFGSDDGSESGCSIAVNGADEVVVVGTLGDAVDFGGAPVGSPGGLFVTRLDSAGGHLGSSASRGTAQVTVTEVALTTGSDIVVAGAFAQGTLTVGDGGGALVAQPSDGDDAFVAKLNVDGTEVWSHAFGGALDQRLYAVAVDPADGAVVVAGSLRGTVNWGGETLTSRGGDDMVVARLDEAGDVVWAKQFGDGNSQVAKALAIDSSGDIWVAGTFNGTLDLGGAVHQSAGNSDIFVARFAATGAHEASARFGEGGKHDVGAIAVLDDGIALSGSFGGTTTFGGDTLHSVGSTGDEDLFVVRLDSKLSHRWSRAWGSAGEDIARTVNADATGALVVGASFSGGIADFGESQGSADALIFELDPDGELVWARAFGRQSDDGTSGVAFTSDGVVATGHFEDAFMLDGEVVFSHGQQDVFVTKLFR